MLRIKHFTQVLILMWVAGGCLRPAENSVIPQIQLQGIDFKHQFPTSPDILTLTLKFKDGDGDLGINGDEDGIYVSSTEEKDIRTPTYYYYQLSNSSAWYPTHQKNEILKKGFEYVNYASHRKIHSHPFDTLPALTCKNWEFRASPADTLYIQQNPYSNNLFVYLYTKNPDGSYTYFDPADPSLFPLDRCVTNFFNGRIVLLSDPGRKEPIEGTITYKIQSSALYTYLHGKTVKLKSYILDRAFHKSNLIESDDFVIR